MRATQKMMNGGFESFFVKILVGLHFEQNTKLCMLFNLERATSCDVNIITPFSSSEMQNRFQSSSIDASILRGIRCY